MRNEFDNIPIPEKLDEVISTKMKVIRKEGKVRRAKQWMATGLTAAIVLVCSVVFCAKNPAFAEKIPLIGHIFERTQNSYEYFSGDYNGIGERLEGVSAASGITITLSEAYCNSQALYLTMEIKSEKPFPEMDSWQLFTEEEYDYKSEKEYDAPDLQGEFIDPCTFAGTVRMNLDYNGEGITVPDKFNMELKITEIFLSIDGNDVYYEGPWEFSLTVKKKMQDTQVVNINETNELGIGFEKVVKDRFEIVMYDLYDDPAMAIDYFPVMLDADGRLMDYGNDPNCTVLDIADRDVSKVDIFLIDYYLWMDELKGDIWRQENPPLTDDGRTYKELLLEKCAYHKEVVFEE